MISQATMGLLITNYHNHQDTETVGETQYFTSPNPSTDAVITEPSMPAGFRLTNAVCTGLPTSSVTPNYVNGTVTPIKVELFQVQISSVTYNQYADDINDC